MGTSKKKQYRDAEDQGGFIQVYFEQLDYPAFRSLSEAAIRVLLHSFRKAYGAGRYAKIFKFTYPEAHNRLGLSGSTFKRAMVQLHRVGFIDYWSKGGTRNEQKEPAGYQLSVRWKKWGTADFEEKREGHYKSVHG